MCADTTAVAPRSARAGRAALGMLWLIDGALQFQPYMFGRTFVTGVILPAGSGQPGVIGGPITWIGRLIEPRVALFNGAAATLEVLIGIGLLYRPTVKAALAVSFAWAGGIWFAGEGLGMIFTGGASPLTGAPGAASLYIVAGLLCWPSGGGRTDRVARWCWPLIWIGSAALWLLPANGGAGSVHDAIAAAPSGAHWLTGLLDWAAGATSGLGTTVAPALAAVSAAVGLSVLCGWHARFFLALAIFLSLCFWTVGQGLGGVFTGQATDVGTAPVMSLIAMILWSRSGTGSSATRSLRVVSARLSGPSPCGARSVRSAR